mmetsp:Transcript_489/g.1189  ORF Transcript_489/g.1189 Transcript_489/m.1189 type:complete len:304 (-) Transcript_489:13-924(-)
MEPRVSISLSIMAVGVLAGSLFVSNFFFSGDTILEPPDPHAILGAEVEGVLPEDVITMVDAEAGEAVSEEETANERAVPPPPKPTLPPTPQPVDMPERWDPECERWFDFRSEIYKPKELAPSILAKPEPCNGDCVAVCICGSLRTFFQPKVSNSIVGTLINQFNPGGRTDVFMVVSEEHSAKGGVYVVSKEDQCKLYSRMNLVSTFYMQAGDSPKTERCRQLITEYENKHKKQYNWVLRPRPDSYWKQMNLRAKTAEHAVYYRHNQFTMLPREFMHNFRYPFRGTPEIEVDVNESPPKFEFYL